LAIVKVFSLAVIDFAFALAACIVIVIGAASCGVANGMITIERGMAVPEMNTRDGYGAVKAR
jgi:predicted branched-subunit amino acid permease